MTLGIFGLVEFVAGSVASLLSDDSEMQAHISVFVYISFYFLIIAVFVAYEINRTKSKSK
ncbi:MAG: hypothetical protein AWU59_2357 [Methanolobus sp. T82-4]|jgi:membrane-bound ClpP family serine protease|nr:MAG: hypothetical protein AWU59_2357 [Methanolobus sp. T82-4]